MKVFFNYFFKKKNRKIMRKRKKKIKTKNNKINISIEFILEKLQNFKNYIYLLFYSFFLKKIRD